VKNHRTFCSFLENLELVNTREVCRFLEVSRLSFSQEYGPKLHEGFVMVRHLANLDIEVEDEDEGMAGCALFLKI
jgi:phospholipase D1/2